MTLPELMQELSSRLETTDPLLNEDGGVTVVFDDEVAVEILAHEGRPGFCFVSTVGSLPDDAEAHGAMMRELLEANVFGDTTNGAALCVDPANDEILLSRSVNQASVSYETFEEELAGFLAVLRAWRMREADGEIGDEMAEPTESVEPVGHNPMMRV